MKIGIIGAGRMGQALAGLFTRAGHDVILSNSRGPESLADIVDEFNGHCSAGTVQEAVDSTDLVFLATPWGKTAAAVSVVENWDGKIVVDTTNNRTAPGPQGVIDIGGRISSEVVAEYVPGARVVKALNVTPIHIMATTLSAGADPQHAVYMAGDDDDAKKLVTDLLATIGGVAIDTGDLHTGGALQGMGGALPGDMEMLSVPAAEAKLAAAKS
ncbi:NADPH-dependent F420 reductase [Rhodococcus sp. ANT_H53B]|uniref:NADPH-dependent F420 reductase n=1 Tax=Rhodococcus sp. ANT_H53B TaxID=2597357 RepID=UPI00165E2665|nr:NAD(P)-binding domain-containing protein [Rhodococcus sp. ANT_H53B]